MRKVLHLCHGLFGNNNGLDTYIRNFIENSPDINYIVVPAGENKSDHKNVIEVQDLYELRNIVSDLDIDILIIHWTGQESLRQKDDLVLYKGRLISLSGRTFDQVNQLNYSPNSFVDVAFLWNDERKHKVIIITHACYKLPGYLNHSVVDAVVHVSNEAYKVNKKLKANHYVIYPCLDKKLEKLIKPKKQDRINVYVGAEHEKITIHPPVRVGWLGRLNKYDPQAYEFIKKEYGGRSDIEFIFAGTGDLDDSPPDNFFFPGNVDPEVFFKNTDIFLYPTSIDSFSLSLLEAMAQAKPCIASEVVKELADIGGAVTYTSLKQLYLGLTILVKSPQLRQRKGKESRKNVLSTFSAKKMTENFNQLFNYLSEEKLSVKLQNI